MNNSELVRLAIKAMKSSYSPYSNFKVGAALLASSNKVYLGCNIENASFSATNCAERTAVFKAISEGESSFEKIAIVGGLDGIISDYVAPCGVCRQVLSEFCDDEFTVILAKTDSDFIEYKLNELLPLDFNKNSLGGKL